jgi:hypothetical protein
MEASPTTGDTCHLNFLTNRTHEQVLFVLYSFQEILCREFVGHRKDEQGL